MVKICVCLCVWEFVRLSVYFYVCFCNYMHLYVNLCLRLCMHVCVWVCVCVCVYFKFALLDTKLIWYLVNLLWDKHTHSHTHKGTKQKLFCPFFPVLHRSFITKWHCSPTASITIISIMSARLSVMCCQSTTKRYIIQNCYTAFGNFWMRFYRNASVRCTVEIWT